MKRACTLMLLLAVIFTAMLTGCTKTPELQKDITVISTEQPIAYASAVKADALNSLRDIIVNANNQINGSSSYTPPQRLINALNRFINACEEQGIPQNDFLNIIKALRSNQALLTDIIKSATDDESTQSTTLIESSARLFNTLLSYAGVHSACSLMYRICDIYFEYNAQKNLDLYNYYSPNPPPFLMQNHNTFLSYRAELEKLGEKNFSAMLRVALSANSAFSGQSGSFSDMMQALHVKDVSLYLKSEADIISRLELTEENIAFIINFLGNQNHSAFCRAVITAQDSARYIDAFPLIQSLTVKSLNASCDEIAAAILDGNAQKAFYALTRKWNDSDWEALDAFLNTADKKDSYTAYFESTAQSEQYAQFCQSAEKATLDELKTATEQDFSATFNAYLASCNPALAFIIKNK